MKMYEPSKLIRLVPDKSEEEAGNDYVPVPKGYRMLIAMPVVSEKTEGNIFLPDNHRAREETASIIGQVVDMGGDCYKDVGKFPNGPWCETGDWIMFRSYAGTRFKIGEREFRLINDDTVEAVVKDPRHIKRA
jgi:co-chaperonin GroES (HSP10)